MHFNFIEIGTSDFDTEVEKCDEYANGICVEPLSFYLDKLVRIPNVHYVNAAISDKSGSVECYYIPEDVIKQYDLPIWLKGCNSIGQYHPTAKAIILQKGLDPSQIFKSSVVPMYSAQELFKKFSVASVDNLKIDTEGHDCIILENILDWIKNGGKIFKISFESNILTSTDKIDKTIQALSLLGYRLVSRGDNTVMELNRNQSRNHNPRPKIFISIASYRDPLLAWTIKDAYDNAKHKDSLVFGIVEQSYDKEFFNPSDLPFSNQIRYVRVDPDQSRGCCWARSVGQTLWNNEDYYFQLDSHIGFDPGWDGLMHTAMKHLMEHHERPLITNMPYALQAKDDDIRNNPVEKLRDPNEFATLTRVCRPVQKDALFKDNYFVGVQCDYVPKKNFVPGYMVAAGCLFTLGKWAEEVPYDPHIFFEGEEQSIALRSWTHGYNIFHISPLMFYHYYISAYKKRFWDDGVKKQTTWQDLNAKSFKRLERVVTGDNCGIYGLGTRRSLKEYIQFTGIDYLNKKIEPKALDKSIFSRDYKVSPVVESLTNGY